METIGGKIAATNEINRWMADAHRRTVESVEGLTSGQLMGIPGTPTNPFLWSLGHVAWFYEIWVLRHHYGLPPV